MSSWLKTRLKKNRNRKPEVGEREASDVRQLIVRRSTPMTRRVTRVAESVLLTRSKTEREPW